MPGPCSPIVPGRAICWPIGASTIGMEIGPNLTPGSGRDPSSTHQGIPSFDESNKIVLFYRDITGTMSVYDDATGSLLAENVLFAFDPALFSRKLLSDPPDHLVLAWRGRIRVIPKAEVVP